MKRAPLIEEQLTLEGSSPEQLKDEKEQPKEDEDDASPSPAPPPVPAAPAAEMNKTGEEVEQQQQQQPQQQPQQQKQKHLGQVGDEIGLLQEHSGRCVKLIKYRDEDQLAPIMALVEKDLSEPYSVFTYRYFLKKWPNLCFLAVTADEAAVVAEAGAERDSQEGPNEEQEKKAEEKIVGVVICKANMEGDRYCGYLAMLAVNEEYRKHGIGVSLASQALRAMKDLLCDEVVLETEVTNTAALRLYDRLGFSRDERLMKYYLNGVDAYRLKLWFNSQ